MRQAVDRERHRGNEDRQGCAPERLGPSRVLLLQSGM